MKSSNRGIAFIPGADLETTRAKQRRWVSAQMKRCVSTSSTSAKSKNFPVASVKRVLKNPEERYLQRHGLLLQSFFTSFPSLSSTRFLARPPTQPFLLERPCAREDTDRRNQGGHHSSGTCGPHR